LRRRGCLCTPLITEISAYETAFSAHPAHGHLVGGERARFVRTDDRRAAERLHRRQTSHNGVLLRHATSSESQARCDDGRQSLWDGSNSQRNRDLEVVDGSLTQHALYRLRL